ncbi:MAG: hypothetical protein QXR69_00640 [Conexivisphaerales archaeon]
MIANRSLERAKVLAEAIIQSGNELISPWVLREVEKIDGIDVFLRDKRGAESCDLLIADVSEPSTGVGMEIMAAYNSGKDIVLVAKKGAKLSRMLLHMDRKTIVEYDDLHELKTELKQLINQFGKSSKVSI